MAACPRLRASLPLMAEVARQLFVTCPPTLILLPPKAWVTGAGLWKSLSPGRTLIENDAGRKTREARAPCSNAGKAHMTKGGDLVWYD